MTSAGFSVVEYERWLKTGEPAILDAIAAYNRDDCVSNWLLRGWLERLRREAEAEFGVTLGRPLPISGEASEAVTAAQAETLRRVELLTADVPVDPAARTSTRAPAGCWRSCSTGTGATTSRPGGTTSGCASSPPRSSSTSPSRSAT